MPLALHDSPVSTRVICFTCTKVEGQVQLADNSEKLRGNTQANDAKLQV